MAVMKVSGSLSRRAQSQGSPPPILSLTHGSWAVPTPRPEGCSSGHYAEPRSSFNRSWRPCCWP